MINNLRSDLTSQARPSNLSVSPYTNYQQAGWNTGQQAYMSSPQWNQSNQFQVSSQLEQFRQRLDQINQMAQELAQVEQNNQRQINEIYQIEIENQRRLEQLSNQEAHAANQVQQIQQICGQANQEFNVLASQVSSSQAGIGAHQIGSQFQYR